jgi:predicted DNA-binding transcriptional regulator YafY
MATTKQTLSRYHVINTCLTSRTKQFWSLNEIIDKLRLHDINISKRTVEGDIEAMRYDERLGYNAPIVYDRTEKAYHYAHPDYSIARLNLTQEEMRLLLHATNMLDPFDLGTVNAHRALIHKIIRQVDPNFLRHAGMIETHAAQTSEEHQQKMLAIVTRCMNKGSVVTLSCQRYRLEPVNFHPYFILFDRGEYHLLGLCNYTDEIQCLSLAGIEDAIPCNDEFIQMGREHKNQ